MPAIRKWHMKKLMLRLPLFYLKEIEHERI